VPFLRCPVVIFILVAVMYPDVSGVGTRTWTFLPSFPPLSKSLVLHPFDAFLRDVTCCEPTRFASRRGPEVYDTRRPV